MAPDEMTDTHLFFIALYRCVLFGVGVVRPMLRIVFVLQKSPIIFGQYNVMYASSSSDSRERTSLG